jgi:hypothetical protein
MMFNGDLMREAISVKPGSWLHRIAEDKSSMKDKIQYLFTAGLARNVRKEELMAAQSIYEARKRDASAMLQDLWWAILNSNEFIINH